MPGYLGTASAALRARRTTLRDRRPWLLLAVAGVAAISGNATTWRLHAAVGGDAVALRLRVAHDSAQCGATSGYLGKIFGHAIMRRFVAVS